MAKDEMDRLKMDMMEQSQAVEEISAKLSEVANMIRASGLFAPADTTAAFLSVAAMNAITDFGHDGAITAFRNLADALEDTQLQGLPN
jgi:hypothetical protein